MQSDKPRLRAPSGARSLEAVKKYYFLTKGLQSAARIICAPAAHKFHTCSLRSIFFAAHVAEENDWTFFRRFGGETLRGSLTSCTAARPEWGAQPFAILCAAGVGRRGALLQRGLRQQLHAVGRLRIACGEPEVRKRGA